MSESGWDSREPCPNLDQSRITELESQTLETEMEFEMYPAEVVLLYLSASASTWFYNL